MDFEQWTLFFVTATVLTVSPGPDILYVLTISLSRSFKDAVLLVLGLTSGLIVHTLVVSIAVSSIKISSAMIAGVQILGAAYLTYIGVNQILEYIFFDESKDSHTRVTGPLAEKSYILQGFMMNLSNPKVLLFFLAFFPSFSTEPLVIWEMGICFYLISIVIFGTVAWSASRVQSRFEWLKKPSEVTNLIHGLAGILLLVIAFSVLKAGF